MAEVKPHLSPEAYLEQERRARFKSEYYRGETFAMSGARRNHVVLTRRLSTLLDQALEDGGCIVFTADMRVHVPATGLYTYPDLAVVCGEEQYLDGTFDTLLNPVLIAEVLSETTEAYDRGKKFELYRPIPSLREYVLVAQDRKRVEVYRLNERGYWELHEAAGDGAEAELASLGVCVALDALYRQVRLEDAGDEGRGQPSPQA
jgi:Uma2 family endonuclease